jgi:hypothetical protein
MKRFHAALLALPLLIPAVAYANDHKSDKSVADWHAAMCSDRYAHAFGKVAFLQAKLGITDKQQDAWNAFAKSETDGAAQERDACLAQKLPSDTPPSALDQEANLEKILSAKLAQLQASRPALENLYKVLDSDQKEEFDRFGDEMEPRHHGGMKGGQHGPKDDHEKPE